MMVHLLWLLVISPWIFFWFSLAIALFKFCDWCGNPWWEFPALMGLLWPGLILMVFGIIAFGSMAFGYHFWVDF